MIVRAAIRILLISLACSCAVAAEQAFPGLPGFEVNVWYGLFAPRNTASTILEKISLDVSRLVRNPEMRERFAALGVESEGSSPSEFKAYFRNDVEKRRKVVRAARVSAD
jgi:tripartite-type tricarboxylate transporter receptor subunit TctC